MLTNIKNYFSCGVSDGFFNKCEEHIHCEQKNVFKEAEDII